MATASVGLVVDRLIGEQELVIKALDESMVSSELVSGASILGDGRVVLILSISDVVEKLGRGYHRSIAELAGTGAALMMAPNENDPRAGGG